MLYGYGVPEGREKKKKLKVKIVRQEEFFGFENLVNSVLKKMDPDDIVDIKYSGSGSIAPYSISYYSAMIIYKE